MNEQRSSVRLNLCANEPNKSGEALSIVGGFHVGPRSVVEVLQASRLVALKDWWRISVVEKQENEEQNSNLCDDKFGNVPVGRSRFVQNLHLKISVVNRL
jgi:hypothetical protein